MPNVINKYRYTRTRSNTGIPMVSYQQIIHGLISLVYALWQERNGGVDISESLWHVNDKLVDTLGAYNMYLGISSIGTFSNIQIWQKICQVVFNL